ncbi:MAG: extracellular solute-binding protein [Lachnospiraceae bacterium]
MKKTRNILLVLLVAAVAAGCQNKQEKAPDKKDPTVIQVWHYYNGAQQDEFNRLVAEFNKTEGKEKGIVVEATSQGTIGDLELNVLDAIRGKVGADEVPNIFAAYGDTAYEVDELGYAVDLRQYFTEEELEEYVEGYIEEGSFSGENTLKIFPVAKSVELLMVNETDWEKFASATRAGLEDLSTIEGVTETAKKYYEWTDSQTPEPNDGKAFFGRDAFANYMISGYRQLAADIFEKDGETIRLNFEKGVVKKLWDNYYIPYIRGYFASSGKFRSDDIKVGNILACVSSSSSVTYFPSEVTLNDEESYPIRLKVLENPRFAEGENYQIQQGAGMLVLKSDEKEQLASVEFLKWFTQEQQNIAFSTASGYLPVKKAANHIEEVEKVTEIEDSVKEVLTTSFQMIETNHMYTMPPFAQGTNAREVLDTSMKNLARQDREIVQENLKAGMTLDEAVSSFETEEYFEKWYEETKAQLLELVK